MFLDINLNVNGYCNQYISNAFRLTLSLFFVRSYSNKMKLHSMQAKNKAILIIIEVNIFVITSLTC